MDVLSEEGVTPSFPSSSATQWEYDVFLSFRGVDTRKNFTDHLYTALKDKGINAFRDDDGLERGKTISTELLKTIEESRFAVIVFSENYADSTWCLDELAKIVECMDKTGMTVLPIFYHVDPRDVRNQTGTFAKAFTDEEIEIPHKQKICSLEKEQTWRAALTKVGSLSGWHLGDRHESKLIRQIEKRILLELHDKTKGDPLPTTKLVGKEFQKNLDEILESLMKVDVSSIGIHGMGGVGKTALLRHIHNRLLENSFNVCWVTASQYFSIKKLQTQISKAINLDLSNEDDVNKRAAKLVQALRRKKRYIIILDDVWNYFSLQEVGIHVGVGCKFILTTRLFDVCRRMECSKNFEVAPLNEEDAWKLFMEKFGDDMVLPLEISDIARSIAKECAGLPLGIITVARSMRGMDINDIHEWRNTLEELNHSKAGLDDMEDKVFGVLKFSFSSLKDPKLQECFLHCSLYPDDYEIERPELINRLIDEGVIERLRSMQAEFDKGHSMLNKLENAYLLEGVEDNEKNKYVKMHGLIRDMAIQIARDSHRFMVEAGKGLTDLPDDEEWKDNLVKASLMHNNFSEIPPNASPRCPKLSTLMLNDNVLLKGIGNSFFVHMSGLKVLNLSNTDIENLPNSISNLDNLTALLLRGCRRLKHVPSLAKLTTLRKLDLWNAGIKEIPQGLEMLVNLRYLNLSYCHNLNFFPTGILPKLSHLQYLVLDFCLDTFKVKGEEVARLKKLETFRGQLYDIHDFNRYVRSLEEEGGLNDYLLQVGVVTNYNVVKYLSPLEEKNVFLSRCSISKSRGGEDSLVLPKDVQCLALFDISDLRCLCDVPSLNNLAMLKKLCVHGCKGIDHILCSYFILPLQSVEGLILSYLDNLNVLIWEERVASSPVPLDTFSRLKEFKMFRCGNIKKLFTPELLLHLDNLEMIDIKQCNELVEIIGASSNEVEEDDERNREEGMDTTMLSLPKLRVLLLSHLPKLKSICAGSKVMVCDSIQAYSFLDCPMLKRLPLFLPLLNEQQCAPPSLKKISASKKCWESLEWDHPNSKTVLQPLWSLH